MLLHGANVLAERASDGDHAVCSWLSRARPV
jgi:hypothetical protein